MLIATHLSVTPNTVQDPLEIGVCLDGRTQPGRTWRPAATVPRRTGRFLTSLALGSKRAKCPSAPLPASRKLSSPARTAANELDHRAAVIEHLLVLPDLGDDLLGVCLPVVIRESPPVSICGQKTHTNFGVLSRDQPGVWDGFSVQPAQRSSPWILTRASRS